MKRIIIFSSILIVFLFGILGADRLILITDPPQGNIFSVWSAGTTLHFGFQTDTRVTNFSHTLYLNVNGPITADWVHSSQHILPDGSEWGLWAFNYDFAGPHSFGFGVIDISKRGIPGDDILHPAFTVDIEWDYAGNVQSDTAEICIDADYENNWYWAASDGVTNLNPSFNYGTAEDPNPWCIKVGPVINCGDANGDGSINVSDAVWIKNFVFDGGPSPIPWSNGSVNCDGVINISDAVWIVNFIFIGGPAPCEC